MRLTRVLLWMQLALFAGAVAVPIASLYAPFSTIRAGGVSASLWVAAGLCFVSMSCAATHERGKLRRLMISGLVAAGLAALSWTGAFWTGGLSTPTWWAVAAVATPLSGWVVLMMLLGVLWSQPARTRLSIIMRAIATGLASVLVLAIVGAICLYPLVNPASDQAYLDRAMRICGSSAILFALSVLGYTLTAWLPALISGDAAAAVPRIPLHVRCPRCLQPQQLLTGGDQCRNCGLRISVVPT
jgi:hypothetical protein